MRGVDAVSLLWSPTIRLPKIANHLAPDKTRRICAAYHWRTANQSCHAERDGVGDHASAPKRNSGATDEKRVVKFPQSPSKGAPVMRQKVFPAVPPTTSRVPSTKHLGLP